MLLGKKPGAPRLRGGDWLLGLETLLWHWCPRAARPLPAQPCLLPPPPQPQWCCPSTLCLAGTQAGEQVGYVGLRAHQPVTPYKSAFAFEAEIILT